MSTHVYRNCTELPKHVTCSARNKNAAIKVYRERKCRYSWHSAGSLGWLFPMPKHKYSFQIKYTEAILSNSTRKLVRFEITKILLSVL